MRRAIRLEPWYVPGRDALAFRLWRRGRASAAAAELEESFYRFPSSDLARLPRPGRGAHARGRTYRGTCPGRRRHARRPSGPSRSGPLRRHCAWSRSCAERAAGRRRSAPAIVADRVALLEAAERWTEAADTLRAEARRDERDDQSLGHAARNYLKANDPDACGGSAARRAAAQSRTRQLLPTAGRRRLHRARRVRPGRKGDSRRASATPSTCCRSTAASADVIAKREQAWTERWRSAAERDREPDDWSRRRRYRRAARGVVRGLDA